MTEEFNNRQKTNISNTNNNSSSVVLAKKGNKGLKN